MDSVKEDFIIELRSNRFFDLLELTTYMSNLRAKQVNSNEINTPVEITEALFKRLTSN